ncbi:hypothetical protein FRC04_012144 [Tulasnella sp. 424]|nr:hypothetical protein FRC04_012144 [Tulasnella sp. 424]KAG8971048.1 hypothetical protein FRC05_011514 [Tulasnella sp. 425]
MPLNESNATSGAAFGECLQTGGSDSESKPTIEQLEAKLAEMERLQLELSLESYRIKRQRNALVPFHRLPGEIFVAILLKVAKYNDPGFDQEHKRLHTLAQVSTYWFDTILAFPSFWQQLAQYHPPWFRDMVLKRNPSGLFNIDCVLAQGETVSAPYSLLSFMKMAAPLSERWKLLAFEGDITDEMAELIQSPAPNLDSMLISNWGHTHSGNRMLKLAEGRNIQYLDIDNIAIPWNSTRLRGLRGVQIQSICGVPPSLAELQAMLAASPQLWWLQLSAWYPFDRGVALTAEVADIHIQPINLPLLTTIILHRLPLAVTQFLLSSIVAPACQCVIVREVPQAVVNTGIPSKMFADLINGPLKAIGKLRMLCHNDESPLHLLSEPSRSITYNWIHHVDELPGFNIQIPAYDLTDHQLGSFLGLLSFPDEVEVSMDINGVRWHRSLLYVGWHRVPKLKISRALSAEVICEQLASVPKSAALHCRLRSFISPLDSNYERPGLYDSIAGNLVKYVQQPCALPAETDQQLNHKPDGGQNRGKLEIKLPRFMVQRLKRLLQDYDVQLSEFGQGTQASQNAVD